MCREPASGTVGALRAATRAAAGVSRTGGGSAAEES